MMIRQFPGYARGWFVVAFSIEIADGEVKPLKYFGKELVAFRGNDSVIRVFDAFCPHLGAHLGYGGKVVGNDIECPFHAWRFGEGGVCTQIPNARRIPEKARVKEWPVRELNGVVVVYNDPFGGEPVFEIPVIPEYGTDEWLPWASMRYLIKTHPREIVENLADRSHFPTVHKTDIDSFAFDVDGHMANQRTKGRAYLQGGGIDEFSLVATYHGPGYLVTRMNGALQNYLLTAHTQVDEETVDLRFAVTLRIVGDRKKTEGFVAQYVSNLKHGFEDDMKIWEHKVFRDQPLLCDGDGPIGHLRRWYRQFYSAAPGAVAHSENSQLSG